MRGTKHYHGSDFTVPRVTSNAIPEDPEDNDFLACAGAGNVNFIVSEDHDLRRLGEHDPIAVVRKDEFLRELEARGLASHAA